MKILIALHGIPDTTSKINFIEDNKVFDKKGVQYIINPQDEIALNKAILLQENTSLNIDITLILVGGIEFEPILRKALAVGGNRAVRINKEYTDSENTAKEIFSFVKDQKFDLILMGKESLEYNGEQVPGLVAALLDYPFVNGIIDLKITGNQAEVIRDFENGKENITVDLPAIFTAQNELIPISEIKIPSMKGIMLSRSKPIQVIEPIYSEKSLLENIGFEKKPSRSKVKLIDPNNLDELIGLLNDKLC